MCCECEIPLEIWLSRESRTVLSAMDDRRERERELQIDVEREGDGEARERELGGANETLSFWYFDCLLEEGAECGRRE